MVSVLVMTTLQLCSKRNKSAIITTSKSSNESDSSPSKQQTQMLLLQSHSDQISGVFTSQLDTTHSLNDIFITTLNKTRNITIWSYLVFLSSLIVTIYYLLIYTNIITPETTSLTCTTIMKLGNILLISSRFVFYIFWNEYLLYSRSVYISYYISNNQLLNKQFPNLKPIKSLNKFKRRQHSLQHNLNQTYHNKASDGETYLYYKIFFKHYIYRFFISLWIIIYLIGLLIYTEAEVLTLNIDSNPIDEDGIICKEIFDTQSMGMFFYTFGIVCDLLTIYVIMDEYILLFGNNLLTILKNNETFTKNIFILLNIKKNVTLMMIAMCSTLIFRLLSFVTGLEATLYPFGYTISILMIFLLLRFNGDTYSRCCGNRCEKCCFYFSFKISTCCCRYNYNGAKYDKNISPAMINQKLQQIQDSKQAELELQITSKQNYI